MASLNNIIQSATRYQDVELATAVASMTPTELQQYIQTQRQRVQADITAQKEGTFSKVYGDLDRASKAQSAIALYGQRTKDLSALQQQVYDHQQESATAMVDDKNLSSRKHEMNEWSVQNKQDTLFVLSALFVVLSALLLLTGLWRMEMIGTTLWVGVGAPLIMIFIMIVVHRSQYTDVLRNKRYWNKQIYEGKRGKIPVPSCDMGLQGLGASLQSGATSALQSVTAGLAADAASAASSLNDFSSALRTTA